MPDLAKRPPGRRIMRTFLLKELSSVDRPAQAPALAVIVKHEDGQSTDRNQETDMPDTSDQITKALQDRLEKADATIKSLESNLKSTQDLLAKAQREATLTDSQRAHYVTLDDTGKSTFLAKSVSERDAVLADIEKANAEVYKALDGTVYRKSDDPRLVNMAKRADELTKRDQERQAELETERLTKRAAETLGSLPKTVEVKATLLKAVDTITDAAVKTEVLEMLKAANVACREEYIRKGIGAGQNVDDPTDPQARLTKMVDDYAKANKVSIEKAEDAVSMTEEYQALYAEIEYNKRLASQNQN